VLRLVRSRSYVLGLGLSLVFSEVCTSLTTRCLHAPLLYSTGLVSLVRPHQLCFWCGCHHVRREQGRGVLARSLIVKTVGSDPGKAYWKAHRRPTCAGGRIDVIHGVTRPGACPIARASFRGALMRTRGKLASRHLSKNNGVVDKSLHLYLIICFYIYIAILVECFTFSSLIDRLVDRIGT
jgi:hypothetical protein